MKPLLKIAVVLVAVLFSVPAFGEILVYNLTEKSIYVFETDGDAWATRKITENGILVLDVSFGDPATIENATIVWCMTDENGDKWYEEIQLKEEGVDDDSFQLVVAPCSEGTYWIIRFVMDQKVMLMLNGRIAPTSIGPGQRQDVAKGLKGYIMRDESDGGYRELATSQMTGKLDTKRTSAYNDEDGDVAKIFGNAVDDVIIDVELQGYERVDPEE